MPNKSQLIPTIILLILCIAYLILVAISFGFNINLETNITMQYILHFTVILSAFAYLFFVDLIYSNEKNKNHARLALIFAALFTLPVLIGRCLGFVAISFDNIPIDVFNFYGEVSVSRTIEMISWTTLFSMSIIYLFVIFFKSNKKTLAYLCLISAICCFTAFASFISASLIYLFVGILGWGIIFLLVIITYFIEQIKSFHY